MVQTGMAYRHGRGTNHTTPLVTYLSYQPVRPRSTLPNPLHHHLPPVGNTRMPLIFDKGEQDGCKPSPIAQNITTQCQEQARLSFF
jgi:hypothetical protein